MKKRRPQNRRGNAKQTEQETAAAEALTAMWLLTVMATLGCEVGSAAVNYFARAAGAERLDMLWRLLFFAALVIGVLALAITPAVYKFRRVHPPAAVTVTAVLISGAPLIVMLVVALAR